MRLLSIFLLLACHSIMPQKKQKVIFFGDSLTELGIKPGGYVKKVDSLCRIENRGKDFEFSGTGISGNKVYDLYLRMDEDIIAKEPEIVVILVGVNDVWHKRLLGTGTDADKFESIYQKIIDRLRLKGIKTILATPAVIGEKTDNTNEQDGDMNKYSKIIRLLAEKNKVPLVDLRQSFIDYNKSHNTENKESGILTYDRVHLNTRGNELVASEMWKAIKSL
jgi:isoamyl acetate esterase